MSQGVGCRALPRSLGYEHPKALFCSWYKSHFGYCGKCALVTKYSWKELNEKRTYFGSQFWRFLPVVGRRVLSRPWRGRPLWLKATKN